MDPEISQDQEFRVLCAQPDTASSRPDRFSASALGG